MNRPLKWVYDLLSRYSRWWDNRVSDDWYDLKTLWGLFNGLFSIVLNVIQFTLLLFLALLLGITHSGGNPVTSLNVPVLLLSPLFGAGTLYRYQTNDIINQQMQTFPEKMVLSLKLQLLTYGSYSLLLLYDPVFAIMAAIVYLFGKGCMLLAFFVSAQLNRIYRAVL